MGSWVKKEALALVGQVDEGNYELYLETATKGLVWMCLDPRQVREEAQRHEKVLAEVAKSIDPIRLVWLDTDEYEEHAKEELGCDKYPSMIYHSGDLSSEEDQD